MKPIKKVIIKDEKYEDGYSELLAKISEKGDLVIDRMGEWGSGHRNMLILNGGRATGIC